MAEKTSKNKVLGTILSPFKKAGQNLGDMYGKLKYGANYERGSNKLKKKYLNELMDKYPKSIPDRLRNQRRKEIKEMVYSGEFKRAKKFVDDKKAEYIKLNYTDKGLQVPEYLK